MSNNIIITGKPGSGKGTQGQLLAGKLNIPHISTGDIFREEMRLKTPLGIAITESMNAGQYTSNDITNAIIEKRLTTEDTVNGFILDGYPRTLNQIDFLDSLNVWIDAVVDLHIDDEVALGRLLLRAQEQNREDDSETIIRGRINLYQETVHPVLDVYASRGLVFEFSAIGKVSDINDKLVRDLS